MNVIASVSLPRGDAMEIATVLTAQTSSTARTGPDVDQIDSDVRTVSVAFQSDGYVTGKPSVATDRTKWPAHRKVSGVIAFSQSPRLAQGSVCWQQRERERERREWTIKFCVS